MPMKRKDVFILKAQIDDDDECPYAKVIEDSGFTTQNIPVLDFEYCNFELLKECLEKPCDYSGIIFTSPRSVKAFVKCIRSSEHFPSEWREHSMYVVGEATKRTLKTDLGLLGQCGIIEDALGLGELIVQRSHDLPLLFPCSDIRRNTLPLFLSDKGVPFKEINVYCTRQNPRLEDILNNTTKNGTEYPEYLVFFSPSGVKYTLPIFLKLSIPLSDIKIVAIGNTTLSALKEANVNVWACSVKPSPQYLVNAILRQT